MKVWKHLLIQVAAVLINTTAVAVDALPPETMAPTIAIVSAIQAIAGAVNHFRNPDGTDARIPWKSPPPLKPRR